MFGDYNLVAIFDAPDNVSAAAFAAAVNAGGGLRSERTQRLLTGDEMVEALQKAAQVGSSYSPPSSIAANAQEADGYWDPR